MMWIGAAGDEDDAGPGTDFHAIREGYVSITPVKVDMTHYDTFQSLSDWLKDGL
jgi:5'-nucleotidase